MAIARILVGVDGSTYSAGALAWAAELAGALDAEVIAVHGAGLLSDLHEGAPTPTAGHHGELVAAVHRWCRPLREAGARHREVVADGPPTLVILRVAAERDADLVVVGTRGRGGAPGLLLGSTSHQVLQLSDRPVTVVPARSP